MKFDFQDFIRISSYLAKDITPAMMYDYILELTMDLTECDAGTFYSVEKDCLRFQQLVTRSLGDKMGPATGAAEMKPIPRKPEYVCAHCAIKNQILNIRDVYYSKEWNFEGTYLFDKKTGYRTKSMLVVPLAVESRVVGVLQLINALDKDGNTIRFSSAAENLISGIGALVALKMENLILEGEI